MSASTTWLSCSVLRAELEELIQLGKIRGELVFLDSMLHMNPMKLQTTLTSLLTLHDAEEKCLVLVYGDCCPRMLNLANQHRVSRVNAINCAQMLVGRKRYRELMQEEAFMLLPEWTPRWKEIFQIELGLTQEIAHDLMEDNRGKLVYLDTGLVPIPHETLAGCAAYTGLPLRIERVLLDSLLEMLLEAQEAASACESKEKSS